MAKLFLNLEGKINNAVKDAVNQGLKILDEDIKLKTPIDTGELIGNNKIKSATSTGDTIKGSVYNDTEYAIYVEYGVKSKKYNYYKGNRRSGGTPFYSGIGARMFTRAYDEKKSQIINLIKQSLKNG